MKRIFISHAAADKELVGEVVRLLEDMGVPSRQIFCSSYEGYGIRLGADFLESIKNELTEQTLVLFILTTNFFNSHMCQCELGAVWVKTLKHIPILVPPLTYNDLEYILRNQQSMFINERNKLEQLYEEIHDWTEIQMIKPTIWEMKLDRFMESVEKILKKNYVI